MKQLKSNLSRQNYGSVLLESLISILIVAIGVIGLISMQTNLIQTKSTTNQNAEAMQLAKDKIESLRNYSTISEYDQLISGSDLYTGVNSNYLRNWRVTTLNYPNNLIINVNVRWQRSNNTFGNITLSSRIGRLSPILSGLAMRNFALKPPPLTP